MCRYQNRLYI